MTASQSNEQALANLALLRMPFPAHHISKLPKPTKKQTDDVKADYRNGMRCGICGTWHHKDVIHLDYVGHAALTDRLLDVDPYWVWNPLAYDSNGLPAFDSLGGLWIALTVCGQTRLGYGHAADKKGGDAIKEVIGDALRNAAMRFGAALDLWHKGELHIENDALDATTGAESKPKREGQPTSGAWESITPELQQELLAVAANVTEYHDAGDIVGAYDYLESKAYDSDTKIALWTQLNSKVRAAIKKEKDARK